MSSENVPDYASAIQIAMRRNEESLSLEGEFLAALKALGEQVSSALQREVDFVWHECSSILIRSKNHIMMFCPVAYLHCEGGFLLQYGNYVRSCKTREEIEVALLHIAMQPGSGNKFKHMLEPQEIEQKSSAN